MSTEPTPESRSAHWTAVADWLDTVNDSRLTPIARIVAHGLAEKFDQHGPLLHVEDARVLELREHPEYVGKDEPGAEVPLYLGGARLLARHGFLEKNRTFVAIAEPSRWNRGRGPTKLRSGCA